MHQLNSFDITITIFSNTYIVYIYNFSFVSIINHSVIFFCINYIHTHIMNINDLLNINTSTISSKGKTFDNNVDKKITLSKYFILKNIYM